MNPASTVSARVDDAEQRVLGRRRRRRRDAGRLDLADQVAVGVDEAGDDRQAAEVDPPRAVRHAVVGPGDRRDAAIADVDGPLGDQRTGFDVEQAPDADRDRAIGIGEGGCRHPAMLAA